MLCERCHEREAIVHITRANAAPGEMTKHDFCEACASDPEGGGILPGETSGWTSYGPDTRTDSGKRKQGKPPR
jgi:hypothetical protein